MPLLVAGLWTNVLTGRLTNQEKDETLETFTHLTTDASPPLRWLHHRQPVFLWDENLALEWIRKPTQKLKDRIALAASSAMEGLAWHPVSKEMSSVKYRGIDATKEVKIVKVTSVKSFFTGKTSTKAMKMKNNKEVDKKEIDIKSVKQINNIAGNTKRCRDEMEPYLLPSKEKLKMSECERSNVLSQTNKHPSQNSRKNARKKGTITQFFLPKSEA